ncbi:MAG: FGGY family carbohydrate kinase [Acidimicrobiales bacterium]
MPKSLLLGVDLGSSAVKAVLLDPGQGIVASARRDVSLFSDHPGWAEADPEEWWTALASLVPELLASAGATNIDVAAVAVAGMVPAVLFVHGPGRPTRRAMLQNDARAVAELRELRDALSGFDMLHVAGSVLTQQSAAPSALWLARHEPDAWAQTTGIVGSYDYVARRLGADRHVERNWALESGLFTLELEPLAPVLQATGLTWPDPMPVHDAGDVVGAVSIYAEAVTGLRAGTPIVVGGADHVLSAYGAGLVDPGDTLVKLGGAGDILCVSDAMLLDPRLYLDHHPIPGRWLPNGCMATSGSVLRWEQALLGGVALEDLDAQAAASAPGALLALPYFLGEKSPLHDPELRGVVAGLHLATSRGDIHRAFLESIAYGFRRHVEIFAEDGLALGRVLVTNGGSRSRLWREILADVLNRDLVSLVDHPGASFGAAVAAGVGVGCIVDWRYVEGALAEGETISPTAAHVEIYEERYREFLELSAATTPISHQLARSTS